MSRLYRFYAKIPAPLRLVVKTVLLRLREAVFWFPYLVTRFRGRFMQNPSSTGTGPYDLVFVLDQMDKQWILGAICREIAAQSPGNVHFHYDSFYTGDIRIPYWPKPVRLPPAKTYFFADYTFLIICLKASPAAWTANRYVYYTHPQSLTPRTERVFALNHANKVISMCSMFVEMLARDGVQRQRLSCVVGAADPAVFQAHQRTEDGLVGFCTAFYPNRRKNPDRILEIVKTMPHRNFVLIGRKWNQYERFSELVSLPNFTYVDVPYSAYPEYYKKMTAFVSASSLEGGPIPLIETMMCNVVPVASRTGFAPDIINPTQNGFLFDVESPVEAVCELIDKAFELQNDVRSTIEHLSWTNFALQINAILAGSQ